LHIYLLLDGGDEEALIQLVEFLANQTPPYVTKQLWVLGFSFNDFTING
jgi:hypothetical protein